jgi:phage baseplate assembly protein W
LRGVGIYNTESPTIKQDLDLLEENITRILLTMPGERVGNPNFGCKFKSFLFDQSVIMKEEVVSEIATAITRWEPRVDINNIKLTDVDPNTLAVRLEMTVKETLEIFTFEKVIKF